MLTINDCLGMCDLCEEEVLAIAEHEHLPEIVALEMAECLIHTPEGFPKIKKMIEDDIEHAKARKNLRQAACLELTLKHFTTAHQGN